MLTRFVTVRRLMKLIGLGAATVALPGLLVPAPARISGIEVSHPECVSATDGGMYHIAGAPLVKIFAAPVYLFDPLDSVDKIHKPSLEPITRATIRIINSISGVSVSEMRAGVARLVLLAVD